MKKAVLIFSLLGLLVLATAVATAASSNHSHSKVYTLGLDEISGAHARLTSHQNGVRVQMETQELVPGDVVTLWWVVFNNPDACNYGIPDLTKCGSADISDSEVQADAHYADGQIADHNGRARFTARLYHGAVPFGWTGNGFTNPEGAEIHAVVRTHGMAIDGRINEMILTFAGACNNVPLAHPGFDAAPGPNHCENIQFAVFEQ